MSWARRRFASRPLTFRMPVPASIIWLCGNLGGNGYAIPSACDDLNAGNRRLIESLSIACRISRDSTFAVKYSASGFWLRRNAAKTPIPTRAERIHSQLLLISFKLALHVRRSSSARLGLSHVCEELPVQPKRLTGKPEQMPNPIVTRPKSWTSNSGVITIVQHIFRQPS